MKILLIISMLVLTVVSCSDDDSTDAPAATQQPTAATTPTPTPGPQPTATPSTAWTRIEWHSSTDVEDMNCDTTQAETVKIRANGSIESVQDRGRTPDDSEDCPENVSDAELSPSELQEIDQLADAATAMDRSQNNCSGMGNESPSWLRLFPAPSGQTELYFSGGTKNCVRGDPSIVFDLNSKITELVQKYFH